MSQERTISIERDILSKNDVFAEANRTRLRNARAFALNFVSSPGSGKTSLLVRTIIDLKHRWPIAVIEGDQQTSRDADRIRSTGAPAVQVNTGKGCHLDAHMVGHALDHLPLESGGLLFIENVGNLVCPAAFDLGEAQRVVVLSVTEGEDKPLKYPDMFAAADLMLLNKSDLLPHLDFDVSACIRAALRVNPRMQVLTVSARTGEGLPEFYAWHRLARIRDVDQASRTGGHEAFTAMSLAEAHNGRDRLRIRVRGAVQGVGFRPFVHSLAARYRLSGFVLNDEAGVLAEVEGTALDGFLSALQRESPPLAHVDGIDVTVMPRDGQRGFTIRESVGTGAGRTRIVPDAATCRSCLDDLFNPASRFHLYPFVTCTHCGPRFTITRRLPYDRSNTSMAGFSLCEDCSADYTNPGSRRFHTETIACPVCGPHLSHPVEEIAIALRQGQIVALKGIGGFHLLCDATNEDAVVTLRRRKLRPAKPFAVMIANGASVEHIATPSVAEQALVSEVARPIVLMRTRAGLAPTVAPGLDRVGVMLPSAPVHHLLFHALAGQPKGTAWLDELQPMAMVATSANAGGEPLIIDDAEALRDLAGIADMIVTHDRPILVRADDSVMAVIDGAPAYIRRSRGFVPEPIDLGQDGPAVLAVGAHLKVTLCVTRGREAFVSQHVGNLNTAQTIRFYQETARRMLTMLDIAPELVACDLHPEYRSTLFAEAMGLPVLRVQHHAAHLAAVAAEHQLHGRIIGVALDGHGHGDDGDAWGGELMLLEGARWRRLGHLLPLALPGWRSRRRCEPCSRMGVAALTSIGSRVRKQPGRFPSIALAGQLNAWPLYWRATPKGRRQPAWEDCSTPPRRYSVCARCSATKARRPYSSRLSSVCRDACAMAIASSTTSSTSDRCLAGSCSPVCWRTKERTCFTARWSRASPTGSDKPSRNLARRTSCLAAAA